MIGAVSIVQVVAVAENGVIGRENTVPWRIKSDLAHFRRMTMGRPVVMGRKTFESLTSPLKGRTNIVVTRNAHFMAPAAVVVHSIEAGLRAAYGDALRREAGEIAIIGGADVFRETLAMTDRIEWTRVHASPAGDTFFPSIGENEWAVRERDRISAGPDNEYPCTMLVYERVSRDANAR